MLDMKPSLPRACETEALAWSTANGWADAPPPHLADLLRRIIEIVFPVRRPAARTLARRRRQSGTA
jgi:hypothetical protein